MKSASLCACGCGDYTTLFRGIPRRFISGHNAKYYRLGPKPRPLEERLWAKVHKTDGCWYWTGGSNVHGYGAIWSQEDRRLLRAHRVSYELHYGSIPEGLFVCHSCDNRQCVRPEHLFLGTHRQNMLDMKRKGRARTNGTMCTTNGHPYDAETPKRRGARICRECARQANREYRKRKNQRGVAA